MTDPDSIPERRIHEQSGILPSKAAADHSVEAVFPTESAGYGKASAARKRFLIIHNPIAGMRRRWMLHEVCRHLRANGAEVTIVHADSLEDDKRLANQAALGHDFDAVVAAGGDSTIRGVASGLIGSDMPLGLIPVGTGNVLAHEIGIRRGPKAVAGYLMASPAVAVPIGAANGEPFCLMASVGFDASVLAHLDTVWKRRMGKLAYIWPVMSELMVKQRAFDARIDGQLHRCTWLIVTKVRHYGGPFKLPCDQDLQSDQFHAVIINARSAAGLMGVLLAIATGRMRDHPCVEIKPCRHVVVPDGPDIATQLDGELFGHPPLDIRMDCRTVQFIVADKGEV